MKDWEDRNTISYYLESCQELRSAVNFKISTSRTLFPNISLLNKVGVTWNGYLQASQIQYLESSSI